MKVKSKVERLIVLTVKDGKEYRNILLQAGATVEDEAIKESDISPYGDDIEEVKATDSQGGNNENKSDKNSDKKTPETVVLPKEITKESLTALGEDTLKLWCKQNSKRGYTKLELEALVEFVLKATETKEPQGGENENN